MRKIVKNAVNCEHCGSQLKNSEEDFFCDECKLKITRDYPIQITVAFEGGDNHNRIEVCSVVCARSWIKRFPLNKELVWYVNLDSLNAYETQELLGFK